MVGDRHAPVPPERLGRHLHSRGGLAALVLGQDDQPHDLAHQLLVEAGVHQLGSRQVALDVGLEDGVEDVVGRQALVVALTGAQLGRRRLGQHARRDDRSVTGGIAPFA